MNCAKAVPLLSALADNEVSPAERAAVEEHLRECPDCRATLAIFRAFNAAVAGTLPAPAARATPWPIPAPALRAAVLAALLIGGTLLYGWLVSANRFPSPGGGNPAANGGNAPTRPG